MSFKKRDFVFINRDSVACSCKECPLTFEKAKEEGVLYKTRNNDSIACCYLNTGDVNRKCPYFEGLQQTDIATEFKCRLWIDMNRGKQ